MANWPGLGHAPLAALLQDRRPREAGDKRSGNTWPDRQRIEGRRCVQLLTCLLDCSHLCRCSTVACQLYVPAMQEIADGGCSAPGLCHYMVTCSRITGHRAVCCKTSRTIRQGYGRGTSNSDHDVEHPAGVRVNFEDVEACLGYHPAVQAAAVARVDSTTGGSPPSTGISWDYVWPARFCICHDVYLSRQLKLSNREFGDGP